jgi:hypothetical protein
MWQHPPMHDTTDLAAVMGGQTWDAFCDSLKAAGRTILRPEAPATEIDRAEGWRYLSRLTRVALEMMLEHADPDFPVFYAASHETVKIGADNPDNVYRNATVHGDREYRIRGTRGTMPFLSFATTANRLGIDGTMASTGELDASNMAIDANGTFEVVLSQRPHPGNWLPMAADSSLVIVRQTYLDRTQETPGQLTIERIDGPAHPEPLDAPTLHRALTSAAAFVRGTADTFANWARDLQDEPNRFPTRDQTDYIKTGGDPNIHYLHGYWELTADEALVIDTPVPECELWNFQLDNYWMESLDYRYRQIHVNKHTAHYNPDGTVTIVVAAHDPGVGNHVDTAGHHCGTMLLRWTKARTHPVPTCRVVPLRELSPG